MSIYSSRKQQQVLLARTEHLTDTNDNKCRNSVENAEVPHPKDNVVQKQSHQTAQADASKTEESQKHFKDTTEQSL